MLSAARIGYSPVSNNVFSLTNGGAAALETAMLYTTQTHQAVAATTIDTVSEASDMHDAANPFFAGWMAKWKRKLAIAKALGAVHPEMAVSIQQTGLRSAAVPTQGDPFPPPSWSAGHEVTSTQLVNALLAIELFPRWVLLLLIFEKLPLYDVAILLNADKKLVKKAEQIALTELTRNVALEQGWVSNSGANAVANGPDAVRPMILA